MDILHPQLINIDGRIYCDYASESNQSFTQEGHLQQDPKVYWDDEPVCDANVKSTATCQSSIAVPAALFKYVIGAQGKTRKMLERDTGTLIKIPGKGCEGDIVITGPTDASVSSAQSRIELLLSEKRWREPFTHFVSIPLTDSTVKNNFEKFKQEVLSVCCDEGNIEESLFQKPTKLHLTLCTLVLLSENEIHKAKAVFQKCLSEVFQDVLKGESHRINVQGLEYMNDDPGAVNVLYVKVSDADGSDKLQNLADKIANEMSQCGFSENQYDRVKLHGTLLNTTFRMARDQGKQQSGSKRKTFNASAILNNFGEYEFGSFLMNEIHLSERHTTAQTGYYKQADYFSISNGVPS